MDYFLYFFHCNSSFKIFFLLFAAFWYSTAGDHNATGSQSVKAYHFINYWLELIIRWEQRRKRITYFEPIGWEDTAILLFHPGTLIFIFLCLLRWISHWRKGIFVLIKGAKFGCCKSECFTVWVLFPFLKLLCLDVQKHWKSLDDISKCIIYRIEIPSWSLI